MHGCHYVCMCGRYAATRDPATLAVDFDAVDATSDRPEEGPPDPDYNVAPTKPVLTVVTRHPRDEEGTPDPDRTVRSIRVMRWGLVPHWAKDPSIGSRMINARAESVGEKPAFRSALAKRRCLLPADGWFEWRRFAEDGRGRKHPYFMTPADGSVLGMAGLWSVWRAKDADPAEPPLVSTAVLTTEAVGPMADIHDRMPLLLPRSAWAAWLDPDSADPGELLAPPTLQLVDTLELRPVSTAVNNVRNKGPELIERHEPDQPALLDLDNAR